MKHSLPLLLLAATAFLGAPALRGQGALDPPAGPPAPGMKGLDQLNAGVPISTTPYLIDSPGRYYAAANLAATGDAAVRITSSNVTFDLNGFAVSTDTGYAIEVFRDDLVQLRNIAVTNGQIPDGSGVFLANVSNSTVSELNIGAANSGIKFSALDGGRCDGNRVEACALKAGIDGGIWFTASSGSGCDGNIVRSCLVTGTQQQGGFTFVAGEDATCRGNVVEDCMAGDGGNVDYASFAVSGGFGTASGNRIERCASFDAREDGIVIQGTDAGRAEGNTVRHCAVANAGSCGIAVRGGVVLSGSVQGNRVESCAVARSGFEEFTPDDDSGIFLGGSETVNCGGNSVSGCVVFRSEDAALRLRNAEGTRLEANHIHIAARGVVLEGGNANFLSTSTIADTTTAGLIQSTGATNTLGPLVIVSIASGIIPDGTHWLANFLLQE